jgi:hypothetical protein
MEWGWLRESLDRLEAVIKAPRVMCSCGSWVAEGFVHNHLPEFEWQNPPEWSP